MLHAGGSRRRGSARREEGRAAEARHGLRGQGAHSRRGGGAEALTVRRDGTTDISSMSYGGSNIFLFSCNGHSNIRLTDGIEGIGVKFQWQ